MRQPVGSTTYQASWPVQLATAAGSACIADFITFPLDTAKVRLQIQGESVGRYPLNPTPSILSGRLSVPNARTVVSTTMARPSPMYHGLVGTIQTIIRQEGYRALYNGLSAGLQRQACFATIRLGAYDGMKSFYAKLIKERQDGLQIWTRVFAGLTTGGLAVCVAQPTDVVKIRFQAQSRSNPLMMPKYTSTFQAYRLIGREEGIKGLWKGAAPNIGRNAIVNVAEIVCYDVVKDCLLLYAHMKDDIPCHFTAAAFAGLCATVAASPIDVVKTRYMNSRPGQYRGALECAMQMAAKEGTAAFYKGFVPSFARIVTWNIALWITYEQAKKIVFTKVEH